VLLSLHEFPPEIQGHNGNQDVHLLIVK